MWQAGPTRPGPPRARRRGPGRLPIAAFQEAAARWRRGTSLAEAAARVVAPRGRRVACCNLPPLEPRRFDAIRRACPEPGGRTAEVDFPGSPEHPAALKVRVLELP